VSQQKLYEAVRSGRVKLTDLNDDGKQALREYMSTKDSPSAPKQSTYSRIDSKIGGILPGGSKGPSLPSWDKVTKWSDRASMAAGEIITGIDNPNKPDVGDFEITPPALMGESGDLPETYDPTKKIKLNSADLFGGLVGFVAGGEFNVGSKIFQGAENAIGQGLVRAGAKSPAIAKTPALAQSAVKVGGATVPYEYSRAVANDREFNLKEATEAGLLNAGIGVLGGGAGKFLSKSKSTETPLVEKEVTSPEVKQDIPADINLARNVVKNTTNLGRINRIIDAYPELAAEYPQFRLQQGDKVILPNGKEATVKTADRMIIQVDVDGKTASVGRKVVKVPETKVEVPEVVPEAIPEVATPEMVTPEIKQQPIINDVPRVNNRSGAETFADENMPTAQVKQEVTPIQPEVVQETLPPTQIKVNRGSKGPANITLPDADHAALFELDRQMKALNNEKTWSEELEVSARKLYDGLKTKYDNPIGTADTYRRSVLNGAKDIEKDGTYAADTFEAVKAKIDADAKRFDIPVNKRTSKNVGDRKVNAMQYNHPELKPYIQEQAKNIMGDLAASLKAERGGNTVYGENTGGENISFGNKRMTTDTIAKILDEQKVSYADIDNALQRIIDDAGQENVALAKRIELLIDEHLTDGYTDIYGNKYPPSKEYVDAKNKAYGTDIKPKEQYKDMSDEDWAELESLQNEIEGKGETNDLVVSDKNNIANAKKDYSNNETYDYWQNKINELQDDLIAKYGEDEVLGAPVYDSAANLGKKNVFTWEDTKLTDNELNELRELHYKRDYVDGVENNKILENAMSNMPKDGPATTDMIRETLKGLMKDKRLDDVFGRKDIDTTQDMFRKIYNSLSHYLVNDGKLPEDFAGDLEHAIHVSKNFNNSMYGVSPKPLLDQVKSIIDSLFGVKRSDSDLQYNMGNRQERKLLPQSEGKPVPPEVLKDYPELSAEVGNKPTSETKTMAEGIGLKPEKAETYDTIDNIESEARKRIESGKGRLNSLPIDTLADYAIIGAAKLTRKAMDFTSWAKEMVADFGARIRPQLRKIYNEVQKLMKDEGGFIRLGGSRRKFTPLVGGPDTLTHIVSKADREPINAKRTLVQRYIDFVDNQYRINQSDKYFEKATGVKLSADQKAYVRAMNSRGSDITAQSILTDRLVDAQNNVIGESFESITKKIPKGFEKHFEDYMINRHAPSWMKKGRDVFPKDMLMTETICNDKVAEYERLYPEFKDVAKEWDKWWGDFGQSWLVDTGIVEQKVWDDLRIEYPHYVKFQRQLAEVEGVRGGKKTGSDPIKKGVGSERKIVSPIESAIEDIDNIVKLARRNESMQQLAEQMLSSPNEMRGWGEIVPRAKSPSVDPHHTYPDGLDTIIDQVNKSFEQAKIDPKHGNQIIVKMNGEDVRVRVFDPMLLKALGNFSTQGQGVIIETTRQVTRMMKNLTTGINPIFGLTRNIFRDIPTAYINSKSTVNPITFTVDLVKAFKDVVTNGEVYRDYKSMGGGHSSSISADRNLLAGSKARILQGYIDPSRPAQATGRLFTKGVGVLENLNNAVESAPRLAEYKRIAKRGGNTFESKTEGLYEANDITVNFKRRGNVTHAADALIPYLNAAVQGVDKLIRVYKDNPVKALIKSIMAVSVPSLILYSINHDDDNYNKLSNFIKDNNYCIPLSDGTFWKIPKPREVGVVFGSLFERQLRKEMDNDPQAMKDFLGTVKVNFTPPMRSIAAPINDLDANEDFIGRPIIPGYMEDLSPELQYDKNTSGISKAIGSATGQSPKKLDYLAKSYLGVIGQVGVPLTSDGGSFGKKMKSVVTADPLYSNDVFKDFYEEKERLDTIYADYKETKIKPSKESGYSNAKRMSFNRTSALVSEIRRKMRTIEKSKLPEDVKQQRLKKMQELMLKRAQLTMDRFNKKDKGN